MPRAARKDVVKVPSVVEISAAVERLIQRSADAGGWWSPMSTRRLRRVFQTIDLSPSDSVLDVGAGTCELVVGIMEHFGCRGVVVDRYPGFARGANARVPPELAPRLAVHELDAASYLEGVGKRRFKMVVCIGAQNIFGEYHDMVERLASRVQRGGYLLVGYSARKEGTAQHADWRHYHTACKAAGEGVGLTATLDWIASDAEWTAYHASMLRSLADVVNAAPDDPDAVIYQSALEAFEQRLADVRRATSFGFVVYGR